MTKWLSSKLLDNKKDKAVVKEGIDWFRVDFYGKYYHLPKTDKRKDAYEKGDIEVFVQDINTMNRAKPNRKDQRKSRKQYAKFMSKVKVQSKKNGAKISEEIATKISEELLNNPEATMQDVKGEVIENLNNALNTEPDKDVVENMEESNV